MQSFLTIVIAGSTAFMAMLMLDSEPTPKVDVFAEIDSFDLPDDPSITPSFVIKADTPLVLALDVTPVFEANFELPMDALTSFTE